MDSKSLRDVLRLMQLGFLGSSRWCSVSSTQHFEMLDTVDVEGVESLKSRRFIRDGVRRTIYDEHLDPLKQQLINAIMSELDLMTQWGVLGEIIFQ